MQMQMYIITYEENDNLLFCYINYDYDIQNLIIIHTSLCMYILIKILSCISILVQMSFNCQRL